MLDTGARGSESTDIGRNMKTIERVQSVCTTEVIRLVLDLENYTSNFIPFHRSALVTRYRYS